MVWKSRVIARVLALRLEASHGRVSSQATCLPLSLPLRPSLLPPWSAAAAAGPAPAKPRMFPLRARQVPAVALPRPPAPGKLRFHHNVSLTVSLAVGTPPQNVTMVLDTGSELSWLLCAQGRRDGAARGTSSIRPRALATFAAEPCGSAQCSLSGPRPAPCCASPSRDLPAPPSCDGASRQCRVSLSYADRSTSDGALATDVFAVGDAPPLRSAFGCMSSAYDSSPDGIATAGLLGMNRSTLSFMSQARTRRFSHYISDRDDAGMLLLGHSGLPFLPLNFTPLYQPTARPCRSRTSTASPTRSSSSASASAPNTCPSRRPCSRRTTPAPGRPWWTPARSSPSSSETPTPPSKPSSSNKPSPSSFAFQEAFDTCFRVPAGRPPPSARLPPVTLLFNGAEMSVAGDKLLYKVPGERRGGDGVWCLTFGNADMVPLTAYVVGQHHHQMNVWVEYDLERDRVGLAPVKCDVASQRLGPML
ncbi:hypothetical protein U9M48_030086 [Paspalum notatum var. saurae]|uniref:Peptidase A1 domain-containing protein n=1 Tax=Paspalum notatum var. saurae TaxID=547442 RepID=A0AAQ3U4N2_PASNO